MQYVYLHEDNSPSSDHCSECGGEAYEGMTGRLFYVHIVTLNENGTVQYAHDTDVCQGCLDGIRSLGTKKTKFKNSPATKPMTMREWVMKYLAFDGDKEEIRKEDIMNWVNQRGMWEDAFNAGVQSANSQKN